MPKYENIEVQLSGEDGNVFYIIGKVQKALDRAGEREAASAFVKEATRCHSYAEVLQLVDELVNVA